MLRGVRGLTVFALALLFRLLASVLIVELVLRLVLPMPMFSRFLRGPIGARIISVGSRGHGPAPDAHTVDPLLGWTNAPGVLAMKSGVESTSPQNLRGTRLYSVEKPPSVLRVEVFGDSFAFGTDVGDESTYSAVLERILPHAEVLNFGVKGYGLDQALLRFRKEGPAFDPDVVVIGFVSALVLRDAQSFTFHPKPRFVLRDDKLVLEGVPVQTIEEAVRSYEWSSRIVDVWRMLTVTLVPDDPVEEPLLVEFVAEIRATGARAVIVRYPVLEEIGRESLYTTTFRDACAQTGATCIDTCPAFDAANANGVVLSAPGANHFNAAGHRIVAGALADALSVAPGPRTAP